jgi:hypothetical protein
LYDVDTPHDNLSFIVFNVPYAGGLYMYSDELVNGSHASNQITKGSTVVPMSGMSGVAYCRVALIYVFQMMDYGELFSFLVWMVLVLTTLSFTFWDLMVL